MKSKMWLVCGLVLAVAGSSPPPGIAGELQTLGLNPPNLSRGRPVMEALAIRASVGEWSGRALSLEDLSDLLWAANGLSRPDQNKTTASSAMNAHDVDIYVFLAGGIYRYDYQAHALQPIRGGDFRAQVILTRPRPGETGDPPVSDAPVQLVLVSDADRFPRGEPEVKAEWGAIDTGIISQNISLFCAGTGLKTRPRVSINKDQIRDLLGLRATQRVVLNHGVGYAKGEAGD